MADRIGIMNDGVLQQVRHAGRRCTTHPANLFVAQFVGSPIMNVADCRCEPRRATTCACIGEASTSRSMLRDRRCASSCSARRAAAAGPRARHPARGRAASQLQPTPGFVPVEAQLIEPLGAYDIVDIARRRAELLRARTASRLRAAQGEPVCGSASTTRADAFLRQAQRPVAAALGPEHMAADLPAQASARRFGAVAARRTT